MSRTYECMFLIDNDAVRAGWPSAKEAVGAVVTKHGGSVRTARRWDERRLAYPIRRRNRATFLLSYCDFPSDGIANVRRDLDISETVLRYLILSAGEIPEEEVELTRAEAADEFTVPEPPADNAVDEPEVKAEAPAAGRNTYGEAKASKEVVVEEAGEAADSGAVEVAAEGGEAKSAEAKSAEAESAEEKSAEAESAEAESAEAESVEAKSAEAESAEAENAEASEKKEQSDEA